MIRIFDFIASFVGLVLLSPLFLVIAIWIKLDDKNGPVFFRQTRVGKDGVDFLLYKFRSMYADSDKKGLVTIGGRDPRITRSGYYIRKYKLDELPQLINVLKGDMSIVGPRPEVRKYVDLYTPEQRRVLEVRPGVTDYASIEYLDENALLALSANPDKTYIEEIMPAKIKLNMKFINNPSFKNYLNIILITFLGISVSKLVHWYFTRKALSFWGVVFLDFSISLVACLASYSMARGHEDLTTNFWSIIMAMSCYMPIYLVTGKIFHTFDLQMRLTTNRDLLKVVVSMIVGTSFNLIMKQFVPIDQWFWPLSDKIVVLGASMSALFMIVERIISKSIYDSKLTKVNLPSAAIYGLTENVELLAQSLENQQDQPFHIEAFLTNDKLRSHHFIWGKKTYLKDENTAKTLAAQGITVLVCGPIMSEKIVEDQEFINQLTEEGIKIVITPQISSLVSNVRGGREKVVLKEIEIEDLLPREPIDVDLEAIGKLLRDQVILITGAAGSIGSELVRQISVFKPKGLVLIDSAETPLHELMRMMQRQWPDIPFLSLVTTITKYRQMESIFKQYRPDFVFHAAAYKHVPMMEISPANAIQNNCLGTRVMADLSVKYGTKKFVMISTDKAVNPTNVMGCSKRICELYCQSLNRKEALQNPGSTQFVTTRFGNVLGSNGSVIPIFKEQIRKGGPVTVTHPDIVRYFMLIPEACKLVLQAGTMGHGGEIYVFDMGQSVRIADLAQRMIDLSGAKNVSIEYTGLRDGEKLYEEVLCDEEAVIPTEHPKIKVAKVREYDYEWVLRNELELEDMSFNYDEMVIVKKMKEMVPEYRSKNSRFEVLDE